MYYLRIPHNENVGIMCVRTELNPLFDLPISA